MSERAKPLPAEGVDPLDGQRQALGEGKHSLLWIWEPGSECPVKVGDIFKLRSCHVEITDTRRVQSQGRWLWRAEITRHYRERVHLLGSRGGYTEDERFAMSGTDESEGLTIVPLDSPLNTARPAEPEAVPPHEIPTYSDSVKARERYEREQERRRAEHRELPPELRLASLRRLAQAKHVDVSSEMRVIERRLAKLEDRLLGDAA